MQLKSNQVSSRILSGVGQQPLQCSSINAEMEIKARDFIDFLFRFVAVQSLSQHLGCSPLSFSALYYLLGFDQMHVHWVVDAISPSHPLLPLPPFAFKLSQFFLVLIQGTNSQFSCGLWLSPAHYIWPCLIPFLFSSVSYNPFHGHTHAAVKIGRHAAQDGQFPGNASCPFCSTYDYCEIEYNS